MKKPEKAKKTIKELIKKRLIKKRSSSEFYKSELPEQIASAVNGAKKTVALSLILFIILDQSAIFLNSIRLLLLVFLAIFLLYKICQATLAAWARLHKLHRVIERTTI